MSLANLRKALAEREEKINRDKAEEELVEMGLERAYRERRAGDQKQREKAWAKIEAWLQKFFKTAEYRQLINQVSRGEKEGSVCIFRDGYGHCQDPKTNACWSEIILHKGKLEYRAGYKWMGVSSRAQHNNLVDLELVYLEKLLSHLESGKVYETIIETTKPI